MAHTRRISSLLAVSALALLAPAAGCTVNTYSTPPGYATPSFASAPRYTSAPRYASAPRYDSSSYDRGPHYAAPATSKPAKARHVEAKPIAQARSEQPAVARADKPHEALGSAQPRPAKPLRYTPVKPSKPLASKSDKQPSKPSKLSSKNLGGLRDRDAAKDSQRGGADPIRARVAELARKQRVERERKGVKPGETSSEHQRRARMQDALAAAAKREQD